MNYNNIKDFHTVVELESLTAAAAHLNISQPALSKAIKNLEQEIGFSLFDHARNKLTLNDNGRKYYLLTKKLFARYQQGIQELRTANGVDSRFLTIAFSSAGSIIPHIIHKFKELYPLSDFTLKTRLPKILDTSSSFTFMASYEQLQLPNHTLLFKEPLYITLSNKSPLAKKSGLTLAQVEDLPFFFPNQNNDMYRIQMYYCQAAGIHPQINVIERNNVLLTLIVLGEGVALMPAITETALDSRDIIQLPILGMPCYRYVYLVENENVYPTRLAKAFKKFVLEYPFKS